MQILLLENAKSNEYIWMRPKGDFADRLVFDSVANDSLFVIRWSPCAEMSKERNENVRGEFSRQSERISFSFAKSIGMIESPRPGRKECSHAFVFFRLHGEFQSKSRWKYPCSSRPMRRFVCQQRREESVSSESRRAHLLGEEGEMVVAQDRSTFGFVLVQHSVLRPLTSNFNAKEKKRRDALACSSKDNIQISIAKSEDKRNIFSFISRRCSGEKETSDSNEKEGEEEKICFRFEDRRSTARMTNENRGKGLQLYLSRPWESIKTCYLILTWVVLVRSFSSIRETLSSHRSFIFAGHSIRISRSHFEYFSSKYVGRLCGNQYDLDRSKFRLSDRQCRRCIGTKLGEEISRIAPIVGLHSRCCQ